MKMNARDMLKILTLLGSVALAACATGRAPPDDTPMATLSDDNQLTYLFGMGDKACTINNAKFKDLGSPEVMVKVKPFAIDVHEVTVEQYQYCVEMEVCSEPAAYNGPNNVQDYYMTLSGTANSKYANYPVVYVTQNQAREYCEFRGKRLPTEFEWELVAGGAAKTRDEKRLYPFLPDEKGPSVKIPSGCDKNVAIGACKGNNADVRAVTTSVEDKVSFGGTSVYDLAGNVMEWTASDADEAKSSPSAKPISATCDWTGDLSKKWTCDDCVTCLAGTGTACSVCSTCLCGAMGMPTDPTATWEDCYAPQAPKFTPICPRYPKDAVLDKSFTGKNLGTKRIIRGGAYISASASGLNSDLVANCFGRSDARVLAKGPQDDPLVFVGFRCAQNVK